MKIFAIADTHLSGQPPAKPMDVFGEHWRGHWEKIKSDWLRRVGAEDLVLIAGDISWAMKLTDALCDLEEISSLPGQKIMVKGNHDYWWQSLSKLSEAVGGKFFFLQNNFYLAKKIAICGSRGWVCPEDPFFTEKDETVYRRELLRVEASLQAAQAASPEKIILLLHFPPFPLGKTTSAFVDLIKAYGVSACVYGHLHMEDYALEGTVVWDGVPYYLVSCDALGFALREIILP